MMLNSVAVAARARPAVDGHGKSVIDAPALDAVYRAQLVEHPLLTACYEDSAERQSLGERFRLVRYLAGFAVMMAGEQTDRLGLVLSGRCRVIDPRTEPPQTLGWVGAGEVLGEMSLMADGLRRHTVVAVRDTIVAELDRSTFDEIASGDPRFKAHLGEVIAQRLAGSARHRPRSATLAILPMGDIDGVEFARSLAEALSDGEDTCVVVTPETLGQRPSELDIAELERRHTYTLYVARRARTGWTQVVLRQADRILFVADAAASPETRPIEADSQTVHVPRFLVLLQPPGIQVAQDTARWLADRAEVFPLHVRRGNSADMGRCGRIALGRARGVAFSGASSRGIGYAGVIRAFNELGFEPDIIAGNSSGSLAAALLARGTGSEIVAEGYLKGLDSVRPSWRNVTLPLVSLLSGRLANRYARDLLGDLQLEDLLVPCVLTAVDLVHLEMVDLVTGPAWQGTRASGSLPIYYPPVCDDNGTVLVDGGVLENFPVRPLATACARGVILVCDLSQNQGESPVGLTDMAPYGAELSGWRLMLRRLWPFGRRRNYPMLTEVLFRTMCMSSLLNQQLINSRAEPSWVFVRPPVPPVGLFGVERSEAPAIIEACRAYTVDRLQSCGHPEVAAALAMSP